MYIKVKNATNNKLVRRAENISKKKIKNSKNLLTGISM